jgi:peptidoglycan/xylan/chitin deacetylase (PgdA/CDA1 family)
LALVGAVVAAALVGAAAAASNTLLLGLGPASRAAPDASNTLSLASSGELERLPTRAKVIALTFDGGGDTANGTALILRTLKRKHAPATFFVAGRWIRRHPQLARAIGKLYPVGNHTYDHAVLTGMSADEVRMDIRRGAYWIRALTRREPRPLFRFPYGARDSRTLAVVRSLGYVSVRWSLDTWGWMGPSEGQSVGTVLHRFAAGLRPGAIVLMHVGVARDGSTLDAHALGRAIDLARSRGYRFVTLERYVRPPR